MLCLSFSDEVIYPNMNPSVINKVTRKGPLQQRHYGKLTDQLVSSLSSIYPLDTVTVLRTT